jgi:hypothetical protein
MSASSALPWALPWGSPCLLVFIQFDLKLKKLEMIKSALADDIVLPLEGVLKLSALSALFAHPWGPFKGCLYCSHAQFGVLTDPYCFKSRLLKSERRLPTRRGTPNFSSTHETVLM